MIYTRVLAGEGNFDYSTRNDNELVNPGESFWKWTTIEDYLHRNPDAARLRTIAYGTSSA